MRSINGHRHGSNGGHSLLQGILIIPHIHIAAAFGTNALRLEPALAILIRDKRPRKSLFISGCVKFSLIHKMAVLHKKSVRFFHFLLYGFKATSIITSASYG